MVQKNLSKWTVTLYVIPTHFVKYPESCPVDAKTLLLDGTRSLEGDGVHIVETGGQAGIMQC